MIMMFVVLGYCWLKASMKTWKVSVLSAGNSRRKSSPVAGSTAPNK
jgi:hypothetical protein|tara:strand:- start:713 stop:850 length:138 start_codon:yes stop_codon:yes gene_type:complete